MIYFLKQELWRPLIDEKLQYLNLLGKQGIDLMMILGTRLPFEKFEIASVIYSKMLHKSSFQLVINTFDDIRDRENLIHLLNTSGIGLNVNNIGGSKTVLKSETIKDSKNHCLNNISQHEMSKIFNDDNIDKSLIFYPDCFMFPVI